MARCCKLRQNVHNLKLPQSRLRKHRTTVNDLQCLSWTFHTTIGQRANSNTHDTHSRNRHHKSTPRNLALIFRSIMCLVGNFWCRKLNVDVDDELVADTTLFTIYEYCEIKSKK